MKKNLLLACMGLLFFPFKNIFAQSLYPVPENDKIQSSSLIIEGRVIAQSSFWNPAHTMIYTSNKVEVYKIFKGTIASNNVEIMTVGGTVGEENITASDLLELSTGETGVFFCYPNSINLRSPQSQTVLFDIWSSSQGVYKYNLADQSASAPFVRLVNITRDVYENLQQKTGKNFENKKPSFNIRDYIPSTNRPTAVSITSFSPTAVIAGAFSIPAENILTITGSGFGASTAAPAGINFDDPDNGTGGTPYFVAATSELVTSWTDGSITVKVPAKVGTGTFSVVDAGGLSGTSPAALDVKYAILNGSFSPSVPDLRQYSLMDKNGSGGYDYVYCTSTLGSGVDFSTSPQEPPFSRAITTWKEIAGLNFVYTGTTLTQTVSAGTLPNIIMMDNSFTGNPPLPSGVLGVCYSSASSCSGNLYARRFGFDIVIRNSGYSSGSTVFNNGPCKTSISITEYDMETVMLHELGHALNLGHINDTYIGTWPDVDPGKLMNSSIVNGVDRRSPDWSAYTGALYNILPRSLAYGGCTGETEMTALATTTESKDECPVSFPSVATPYLTAVAFDLNHATSNKTKDPQYTAVNTTSVGVGITNNAFYAIKTAATGGGSLLITVSGYSTTPASQAACSGSGVELSLYLASTCPTAQAYPTPLAYRTFSGSGALTAITGLSTSTNYLIMVDGISNTRASFTLTFGGSVLPINLLSFTGEKNGRNAVLKWQTGSEYNNDRFDIETSKDGINFYKIGTVRGHGNSNTVQSYNFTDFIPAKGINYYRLRQVDIDNHEQYSQVINLRFDDNFSTVIIFPNPATDILSVSLSQPAAKISIRIFGADGRLIKFASALAIQRFYEIDINKLSGGYYIAEITIGGEKVIQRFIKK